MTTAQAKRKPGPAPLPDIALLGRGSRYPAARRKAAQAAVHRARITQRPKFRTIIYDPCKTILELPGYDPRRDAKGFVFDPSAARAAIAWIHKHLTHVKGEWAAKLKPFQLARWQQGIVANLFGWKDRHGLRRYREAFVFVPRKNGKTTMVAAICNYVAFTDDEPGSELYSAAADREQARLIFATASGQVRQDARLIDRARIYHNAIVYDTGATYKPLSAEAGTKHGLNSHLVAVDELHAHPDRELVDVLMTSTGARRQPLVIHITTSDYERPSICNQKHDYASKVRDRIIDDPRFLPAIWEVTKDDDWTAEATWKKANPNYGVSVSREYIARECQRAKDEPEYENEFKRLHLNIRTEQARRWLVMVAWDACGGRVDEAQFAGKPCWGGLDIGATSDLTALCLLFPVDDGYVVIWRFWCPRDTALKRETSARVPYLTWARDGALTLTDGNETDYGRVKADVKDLASRFALSELAVDRAFQGAQLCQDLQADGLPVVIYGQGMLSMSAPTKEFGRLVNLGKLRHGAHPVARWMASNVAIETDSLGNARPSKKHSAEKIDGIVAAVMALGRAMVRPQIKPMTPGIAVV